MTDITSPKLLWTKGALFLLLAIGASVLIVMEAASLKVAVLLVVAVWGFCRAYYFAFYVIEHYADRTFRYSGLSSAAWFVIRRFFGTSSGNSPENIR